MTDLALIDSPIADALQLFEPAARYVEKLCRTNFVPSAYRGKPDEALACVMMGEELGLKPLTALREIAMIQGTPALSAKLQRALVQRRGHEMWMVESSSEKCVFRGRRADWPADRVVEVSWTMDEARKANLANKDNWKKHPADMLIARASSRMARMIAPEDLLGVGYSVEELEDGYTDEDATVDAGAPPAPAKSSRARKLPAKKAAAPVRERVESTATKAAPDPLAEFDDIESIANGDADIVEAEIVEDAPDPASETFGQTRARVDGEGPRMSPHQALAVAYRDAGLPEDMRHGFYNACWGVTSGKDLDPADRDAAFELLRSAADGDSELRLTREDGLVVVMVDGVEFGRELPPDDESPPQGAAGGPLDGVDDIALKGMLKVHGRTWPNLVRHLGSLDGVEAPTTVAALLAADVATRTAALEWIEAGS